MNSELTDGDDSEEVIVVVGNDVSMDVAAADDMSVEPSDIPGDEEDVMDLETIDKKPPLVNGIL